MKKLLQIIIVACLFSWTTAHAQDAANIIFIIGDDISWDDIGAYGNSKVKTPNLDKLASNGLKFNNMYLTTSS